MSGERLELRHVSMSYGRNCILSRVSLPIVGGQHLALLGPSGSGKSTVLRLLAGLEAPDDGEVLRDGKMLSRPGQVVIPPHRRGLALVFQDLALWPSLSARDNVRLAITRLLILASFIGGCAGSTAGGIKVIRCLLVFKQGMREITRLVHPSAEIPVKLGNAAVPVRIVDSVWGFFSIYIVVFGFLMLAMLSTGMDQVTAFSAVAASLNNLGPGLGDVASGFMTVTDAAKWLAVVGMLMGRLEIFTLLVLFTPTFWRR